ncbi:MAG: YggS family pyridoxal phosphate-dependent enzyme [Chitinophagaceae bacterium]|nr:MAG: YggS family pyridoxal phosphate-dependent enzyme [Chitinophagaceae bacterium]
MAIQKEAFLKIKSELEKKHITLVAVSKTQSIDSILQLYELGQRDFGENYVQELVEKHKHLPSDIRWHFIGHLQSNKAKKIISFVHLIQTVDSLKLLQQLNKEAKNCNRNVNCLLQVRMAQEETKFGLNEVELSNVLENKFENVSVCGLMGLGTLTNDVVKTREEFSFLKRLQDKIPTAKILSMGMSSDFKIAIEEGSTLVRIGSLLFGERN